MSLGNAIACVENRCTPYDEYGKLRGTLLKDAAIISVLAKIPYIPISLKWGPVLGKFSVMGNVGAFFVLEFWAAKGSIGDVWGPQYADEKGLGKKMSGKKVVVLFTGACLIALASQIAAVLPGVKYNAPEYKVVAGIVLFIAGSLFPLRSIQLSLRDFKLFKSKWEKAQEQMVGLLYASKSGFEKRRKLNEGGSYIVKMVSQGEAPSPWQKTASWGGWVVGLGLTGMLEYSIGRYTYEVSKEEIGASSFEAVVLATVAVGSSLYLTGLSIVRTAQRVLYPKGETERLGWQLRPKLSFALTAIGIFVDLCAVGATYVIWQDFYAKDNPYIGEVLQKSVCGSLFLMLFTAMLDIVEEVVEVSVEKGTDEERELLAVKREFLKLAALVQKSSTQQFMTYLTGEPELARKLGLVAETV